MDFFYSNSDPLLSRYTNSMTNPYNTQLPDAYTKLYHQQLMQQQGNNELMRDWIGELDCKMKKLKPEIAKKLNENTEFIQLNNMIQNEIQAEIISIVKIKLNNSQEVQNSIKRQLEIIDNLSESTYNEERQNIMELNDYLKNYSHLTFDEYKRIKNGETTIKTQAKQQSKDDEG